MRLVCVGLGYSARRLVKRVPNATVWGTRRQVPEGDRAPIDSSGATLLAFDAKAPESAQVSAALGEALDAASHVLISIPAERGGCPAYRALGDRLKGRGAWIGYLSTTGVYGDRGGAWVSERDAPTPDTARGRDRLAAENQWRGAGLDAHVFRLGGIYGPGRSVLDKVRAGEAPVEAPGHVFNRIHVNDIAGALEAAMLRPAPGSIVNLVDDRPTGQPPLYAYAATLLQRPAAAPVSLEAADLSPMGRSFFAANRRVLNARAKALFGWRLTCPSYREGLDACLAEEEDNAAQEAQP